MSLLLKKLSDVNRFFWIHSKLLLIFPITYCLLHLWDGLDSGHFWNWKHYTSYIFHTIQHVFRLILLLLYVYVYSMIYVLYMIWIEQYEWISFFWHFNSSLIQMFIYVMYNSVRGYMIHITYVHLKILIP